jgi:hypothetical protein
MRKLRFVNSGTAGLTFSEGCELYLMNCRQRNLREGTINHYRQSYTQFYKYFDPEMPVGKFNSAIYNKYVIYLCDTLHNDISVNSYLRDLITTLHFLMDEGYVQPFKMQAIISVTVVLPFDPVTPTTRMPMRLRSCLAISPKARRGSGTTMQG